MTKKQLLIVGIVATLLVMIGTYVFLSLQMPKRGKAPVASAAIEKVQVAPAAELDLSAASIPAETPNADAKDGLGLTDPSDAPAGPGEVVAESGAGDRPEVMGDSQVGTEASANASEDSELRERVVLLEQEVAKLKTQVEAIPNNRLQAASSSGSGVRKPQRAVSGDLIMSDLSGTTLFTLSTQSKRVPKIAVKQTGRSHDFKVAGFKLRYAGGGAMGAVSNATLVNPGHFSIVVDEGASVSYDVREGFFQIKVTPKPLPPKPVVPVYVGDGSVSLYSIKSLKEDSAVIYRSDTQATLSIAVGTVVGKLGQVKSLDPVKREIVCQYGIIR